MLRRGIVIIAMVALFFGQMMTAAHAHDDHGHDDEQQASCVVCLAATAEDDLVSDTGLDEPTGDGCGVDLEFIPASLLLEDAPATLDSFLKDLAA